MKDKIDHQNLSSPEIDFNDVATINMSSKMYLKRKAYLSRVIVTSVEKSNFIAINRTSKTVDLDIFKHN